MKSRLPRILMFLLSGCLVPASAWSANLVEYIILVSTNFHHTERVLTDISLAGATGLLSGTDVLACVTAPNVRYVMFNPDGLPLRGEAGLLRGQVSFVFERIEWNWVPKEGSDGRYGHVVANGQDLGETSTDASGRLRVLARLRVQCECPDTRVCAGDQSDTANGGGAINNIGSLVITHTILSPNGATVEQSLNFYQPQRYQIVAAGN